MARSIPEPHFSLTLVSLSRDCCVPRMPECALLRTFCTAQSLLCHPWMPPIPKRFERPRWNDWTTRRRVQFHYEDEALLRAVRLTTAGTCVGEAVRVAVSGVEVEGRIIAIDGVILRVALSTPGAKKKMAKATPRPSQRRRGKAG